MNLRLIKALMLVLEINCGTGVWLAFFYYGRPSVGWVLIGVLSLLAFLGELSDKE